MKRVSVIVAVAAAVVAAGPTAAEWPNDKPIRVLVGFGPGGGTDIVTSHHRAAIVRTAASDGRGREQARCRRFDCFGGGRKG